MSCTRVIASPLLQADASRERQRPGLTRYRTALYIKRQGKLILAVGPGTGASLRPRRPRLQQESLNRLKRSLVKTWQYFHAPRTNP